MQGIPPHGPGQPAFDQALRERNILRQLYHAGLQRPHAEPRPGTVARIGDVDPGRASGLTVSAARSGFEPCPLGVMPWARTVGRGWLCLVRKARRPCRSACCFNHRVHEGPQRTTKVCQTCRPGDPVGDARAFQALRAPRHHEAGHHCLDLAAVPRFANACTGRAWFQPMRAVSITPMPPAPALTMKARRRLVSTCLLFAVLLQLREAQIQASGRRMGHERRADDDQDAKRAAAAGVFQWTTPKRKIVVL
jgi:hypothetical protein